MFERSARPAGTVRKTCDPTKGVVGVTSYWHPFADMGAVEASGELPIVRGEGAYVFDAAGRRYFDATAGLWYCNVGHGRGEIADAAAAQMRELAAYNNYGDLTTRPASELAERVAALAPVAGSKVFFASGGSDAIDSAGKLARRYWQRARPAGEDRAALAPERLPRCQRLRHEHRRDRPEPRRASGRCSSPRRSTGTRPPRSRRRSTGSGRSASRRSSASR